MKNWLRFTEVNLKSKDNFKNPDSVVSQGFLVLNSYLPSSQFNLKKKNIPNFILQSLCRVNVGYTSAKFVLYLGVITLLAMVNKTIYNMRQPELGHKIQNWRKAKGLTQEELVEQCNLNVRTLQRIEAGEVLPRSYTVKSILEVLKVDFSELDLKEDQKNQLYNLLENKRSFFKWGAIIGIIYLCLSFVEGFMDVGFYYWNDSGRGVSGVGYSLVKIGVMLTFTVFYFPFYLIGKALNDNLIKISSLFLIVIILISNIKDIAVFYTSYMSLATVMIARSVMFGIGYILIGISFVLRQKSLGKLSLVTGIFGIVTGLGFVSILLAIPALFTLTVFEILMLVMIFKVMNYNQEAADKNYHEFSGITL